MRHVFLNFLTAKLILGMFLKVIISKPIWLEVVSLSQEPCLNNFVIPKTN